MVLNLPAADHSQLARSPLVLTVCQIRFEETLAVADARLILEMHERLGGTSGPYPRIEQVKGPAFEFALSGEGMNETQKLPQVAGWTLQSDDGSWIASIMPNHVALETKKYTRWDTDFGP